MGAVTILTPNEIPSITVPGLLATPDAIGTIPDDAFIFWEQRTVVGTRHKLYFSRAMRCFIKKAITIFH